MISQTSSQWGSWSHDLAGKENGFPAHRKVRALSDSLYCKASRLCIEVTQSKQLYGVGMSQHSFESLDRRYQESLYFSFLEWTLQYKSFFCTKLYKSQSQLKNYGFPLIVVGEIWSRIFSYQVPLKKHKWAEEVASYILPALNHHGQPFSIVLNQ